jgi:hypothetical protein
MVRVGLRHRPTQPDKFDVTYDLGLDVNGSGFPDECEQSLECGADGNGDAVVDVNDISYVHFRLGETCPGLPTPQKPPTRSATNSQPSLMGSPNPGGVSTVN